MGPERSELGPLICTLLATAFKDPWIILPGPSNPIILPDLESPFLTQGQFRPWSLEVGHERFEVGPLICCILLARALSDH